MSNVIDEPINCRALGLTKREYFAGLAMQALIIRGKYEDLDWSVRNRNIAAESAHYAEYMLEMLQETRDE